MASSANLQQAVEEQTVKSISRPPTSLRSGRVSKSSKNSSTSSGGSTASETLREQQHQLDELSGHPPHLREARPSDNARWIRHEEYR